MPEGGRAGGRADAAIAESKARWRAAAPAADSEKRTVEHKRTARPPFSFQLGLIKSKR